MKKVLFVSLGCDKNLVDTEYMIGALLKKGYSLTNDETEADVIVINTCSFIHDAQTESVENILEMTQYRREGNCRALVIAGCMAQSYGQDILEELPEVDAVIGTNSYASLPEVLERIYAGERLVVKEPLTGIPETGAGRVVTTGGHFAYLKIAEGCDKHCTYCVIPKLRGRYRSVPMEKLLAEAQKLAADGVSELELVAQETTLYGVDLYGEKRLHQLLEALCRIEGLRWIRILYCYPEEIYPELTALMRREEKICRYLDLPIQHCNDEILHRMGRKTDRKDLERIVSELRRSMPDITLRTTLITGFPGETQAQHEELLDFVREMRFDRLGVFTYSQEDGTPAGEMPDQIPEEVKEARKEEIMLLQQEISKEKNEEKIGRTLEVFTEGYVPEDDVYVGRTQADAPNIDGYLFFTSDRRVESGMFVNCRVTGAAEYDLLGENIENESAK